jgi:hypothetical protein
MGYFRMRAISLIIARHELHEEQQFASILEHVLASNVTAR